MLFQRNKETIFAYATLFCAQRPELADIFRIAVRTHNTFLRTKLLSITLITYILYANRTPKSKLIGMIFWGDVVTLHFVIKSCFSNV